MGGVARLFWDAEARRLGPLLRGHLLLYERREGPSYSPAAGLKLLLVVLVLEGLIGPRMEGLHWLGLTPPPELARIPIMIVLTLAAARFAGGVRLADVGVILPWRWRAAEGLYLGQFALVGGVIFALTTGRTLGPAAGFVFLATQMLWGLQQELVYRGLLQTELMRRFGTVPGLLVAAVAFTFGPLHFYHLQRGAPAGQAALGMAAIFAAGLVLGIIYARTRNVLFAGLLHGVVDLVTGAPPRG